MTSLFLVPLSNPSLLRSSQQLAATLRVKDMELEIERAALRSHMADEIAIVTSIERQARQVGHGAVSLA